MIRIDKYLIKQLKSLIRDGETAEALKTLDEVGKQISDRFHDDVIMQNARFKRLSKEKERGVIYDEAFRIETAKIDHSLLSLIGNIDDEVLLAATIADLNKKIGSDDRLNIEIPDTEDLEKIIGKNELLDINWLEKALKSSKSVCKVLLPQSAGTGFLLKGGYLLTNNHVISSDADVRNAKAIFNFYVDANGYPQRTCEYRFDPTFYKTSTELDYSLVKIIDNDSAPVTKWGYLELDDFSQPEIGEKVNIIQHPEGKTMKMAMPDKIISVWNQYLFYVADTKGGSSGSPVFNQDWKVIALHHAGRNDPGNQGGLQINALGENKPSNRGILIKNVLQDLKSKGFSF